MPGAMWYASADGDGENIMTDKIPIPLKHTVSERSSHANAASHASRKTTHV